MKTSCPRLCACRGSSASWRTEAKPPSVSPAPSHISPQTRVVGFSQCIPCCQKPDCGCLRTLTTGPPNSEVNRRPCLGSMATEAYTHFERNLVVVRLATRQTNSGLPGTPNNMLARFNHAWVDRLSLVGALCVIFGMSISHNDP